MATIDDFYSEVQRVLCPDFKKIGRNLDAFVDVLRGGFGTFNLGEEIEITIRNRKFARKHLPESFMRKILRIIDDVSNVEFVSY